MLQPSPHVSRATAVAAALLAAAACEKPPPVVSTTAASGTPSSAHTISSAADGGKETIEESEGTDAETFATEQLACMDWVLVDEGFNCLGLAPECWTRVTITTAGEVSVEQPIFGDASTSPPPAEELDNEDQERALKFMCDASLISLLETPGACSAIPCNDVFVVVEGSDSSGRNLRNPVAGPCVCTDETHPFSRLHAFVFSDLLPKYFPSVKHPPHL